MLDERHKAKLQAWITQKLGADDLVVEAVQPLGGGSIQENWRVRCVMDRGQKTRDFVLRKDAPATIASSRPRSEEFAILSVAYRAGVCVPEPIGFCSDPDVIGAPFAMMGLVEGGRPWSPHR
jgi:aminoglycoside phosphotransferase (APT) family kinase protein